MLRDMDEWRVVYISRKLTLDASGRPAEKSETISTPSSTLELAAEAAARLDRAPDGGDVLRIEGPNGRLVEGEELRRVMAEAAKRIV